jgi:hypothetical protein
MKDKRKEDKKYMLEGGSNAVFSSSTAITFYTKQEAIEEVAERYSEEYFNRDETSMKNSKISFIDGAQWQAKQDKNKYSNEDVLQILFKFTNKFDLQRNIEITSEMQKEWFENLKKK